MTEDLSREVEHNCIELQTRLDLLLFLCRKTNHKHSLIIRIQYILQFHEIDLYLQNRSKLVNLDRST